MPAVSVNGIEIHYDVLGADRPGTPLVLTHGFASASAFWRPEIELLAEKRPLVTYDVRGHGETSAPDDPESYSLPAFAADLAALLREIGIERAHIGGVSMGGMITAQFAVDYPDVCESILLCDTTCGNAADLGPGGDWERRLLEGISALQHLVSTTGLRETLIREWEYKEANDPHFDVMPYSLEDDFRRIEMMTVPGYVCAANAIAARPDLTERVTSITAPALVLIGEWDDFLPCAERDHSLIPGSRLVVREECAHGSRWRLDTFRSEIEAFLADVEAGRPVAGQRRI
ncbi:MAG TPA: alpha/beta hydrolase [Dehalococcoidia bacterium]